MQFILSRQFEKEFAKLPKQTKIKAIAVLELFVIDVNNPSLRVHAFRGKWVGHYSIDVTGDTRAIYYIIEKNTVRFVTIDTHSQLYE